MFAHILGLTCLGMCFHCSCSCRRYTFPPKEFSYKIFKATYHSFLKFFVAHFILKTVSYGVSFPFRSTGIDYPFNLSYYSRIWLAIRLFFVISQCRGLVNLSVTLTSVLLTPNCSLWILWIKATCGRNHEMVWYQLSWQAGSQGFMFSLRNEAGVFSSVRYL